MPYNEIFLPNLGKPKLQIFRKKPEQSYLIYVIHIYFEYLLQFIKLRILGESDSDSYNLYVPNNG